VVTKPGIEQVSNNNTEYKPSNDDLENTHTINQSNIKMKTRFSSSRTKDREMKAKQSKTTTIDGTTLLNK
jgi:hypothetical protein